MSSLSPSIAAVGLVLWTALVVATLRDPLVRPGRAVLGAAAVVFTLSFLARYLLVAPSFVHANFHGASLVDAVLAFPAPPTHRPEYGVLGFAWLGAIASVFGEDFETIRAANCAFGSVAVTFTALFARSLSGRDAVGIATAALGVGSIPLLRIASSEDVHNVGLALAAIGLWALDVHLTTSSRRALALTTASLVAMCFARQTFFVLLPTYLLLLVGRGLSRTDARAIACAALVVAVAFIARFADSLRGGSQDGVTYGLMPVIFGMQGFFPAALGQHPLLSFARFGPLVPCALVVGVVRCALVSRASRALLAAFVLTFMVTLPFGFPTPGVELAFRLPAILLALVVGGFGAGFVYEELAGRVRHPRARPVVAAVFIAAAALATATSPARAMLAAQSPDYLEYVFWTQHLHELPRNATLVVLRYRKDMPAYAPSRRTIATRPDLRVVELQTGAPPVEGYFLSGPQCWGYSLEEEIIIGEGYSRERPSPELQRRLVPVLFGGRWRESGLSAPRGMRPECRALLEGSVAYGTQIRVRTLPDVPFVIYAEPSIPIGFRELSSAP